MVARSRSDGKSPGLGYTVALFRFRRVPPDMSDFDKEAEREKLREKFARDEQKRAQTSRMSELLLKGATMTNKHHDCGSPVFRWKGEEFCPTCQGGPSGGSTAEREEGVETGDVEAGGSAGQGPDVGAETEAGNGSEAGAEDGAPVEIADTTPEPESEPGVGMEPVSGPTSDGRPEPESAPGSEHEPEPEPPTAEPTTGRPERSRSAGEHRDGGVAAARASLERTLAAVARRAERTDDLSEKRDYLAAAKEAAEALEATKRAGR
jgi:uncharacterized Zn finger protein (UPF0148 family)